MKRFFSWSLTNGLFISLFIVGLIFDKYGFIFLGNALTVVYFLIALLAFLVLFFVGIMREADIPEADDHFEKLATKFRDYPKWLEYGDPLYDMAVLIFFAYYGLLFALVFYLAGSVLLLINRGLAERD